MRRVVLTALVLLAPAVARAEKPARLVIDAGFTNAIRSGVWTPIVVELENPGAAFDGTVTLRYAEAGTARGASAEPVELGTGAKRRVTLYARPRAGAQRIEVTLTDARGRVRAGPEELQIDAVDDDTVLVGVVSMGARSDPGLRPLIDKQTRVVVLDAEQLPDAWPAFNALDALVLRDPDAAALGPARIDALKTWVSNGGVLAVTAGEKWRAMNDPAFTEMLPVKLEGVKSVSAADLPAPWSQYAGELAVTVTSPLRGETVLSLPDGKPLVSEARYGMGRVIFLASDPGDLGGVDAIFKGQLWAALLKLPPRIAEQNPYGGGYPYGYGNTPEQFLQQELSRIPPLKPPSVLLVTLLIGLYVTVVGPGDYFFLKKLGKLHWTWVTYPAAIAGFSALIYMYATLSRSSEMMLRTIALVDVPSEPPGAPAPMRVFGGVYSPRAGSYKVAIKTQRTIAGSFAENNPAIGSSSSSEYLSTGGKKPTLTLSIPIWSMAGVDLSTQTSDPAPFLVEAISPGTVKVTNTGSVALEYVGMLVQGKVIDGGRLEPGKNVKLSRADAGHSLTELPNEMQSLTWNGKATLAGDVGRIVRVFAYATDPPYASGATDPYYLPKKGRRTKNLERPRDDQSVVPVVFAVAKTDDLPIAVPAETVTGAGTIVWRRPVPSAALSRPKQRTWYEEVFPEPQEDLQEEATP